MEEIQRPKVTYNRVGQLRQGVYEPGNGTRYTAIAVPIGGEVCMGVLGSVTDGWLVVSGNSGKAYLFQGGQQPLYDDYVRKHLGGLEGDYPFMGDLMRELIARPGPSEGEHQDRPKGPEPGE